MTINIAPALRGLGICALLGALTTLLNTVAPSFYSASDFDSRMALIHNPIYACGALVAISLASFAVLRAGIGDRTRCSGRGAQAPPFE